MILHSWIEWIETHQATVGLVESALMLLLAWFSGAFAALGRFRRKARVEIVAPASFVFLDDVAEKGGVGKDVLAAFVLNVSVINATNEKVVVEQFLLSYRTANFFRSFKQRLVRIPFMEQPRKRVGGGHKYHSVWFTNFPASEVKMEPVSGTIDPKEYNAGYLLFVSCTTGGWNPVVFQDKVKLKLSARLTTGERITACREIRVVRDKTFLDEFSPKLSAHVADKTAWNHDLSIME